MRRMILSSVVGLGVAMIVAAPAAQAAPPAIHTAYREGVLRGGAIATSLAGRSVGSWSRVDV